MALVFYLYLSAVSSWLVICDASIYVSNHYEYKENSSEVTVLCRVANEDYKGWFNEDGLLIPVVNSRNGVKDKPGVVVTINNIADKNYTLIIPNGSPSSAGGKYTCKSQTGQASTYIVVPTWRLLSRNVYKAKSYPRPSIRKHSNYTSPLFRKLLLEAQAIVGNTSNRNASYNSTGLLQALKNATDTTNKRPLTGGDLNVTMVILTMFVNNSQINNDSSMNSDVNSQNFVDICSNILDLKNAKHWMRFEDEHQKEEDSLWKRMVFTSERYGLQLTNQTAGAYNRQITSKNAILSLNRVTNQNKMKQTGLMIHFFPESSLFLPSDVFSHNVTHQVVSIAFKTMNAVMRLYRNKTSNPLKHNALIHSNTTLVSSVVRPAPQSKLHGRVKIVLKNIKVNEPVQDTTCVFWKKGLPRIWGTEGCYLVPDETNSSVTTCECNHLTIFAALMDPFGKTVPEDHCHTLELISAIGCAISLFGMLITILVTTLFWRKLKSPRTIVLMNICVAIGVVCILVLVEITARHNKIGCIIIAASLHYFLLGAFCWMLCEGVLLYLMIIKVIGTKPEQKVKLFFLFGWGMPLLIVGPTLATTIFTDHKYIGNREICWLAVQNGIIWTFVGPAIVILLINIVVFVLIIRKMLNTRRAQNMVHYKKFLMAVKATAVSFPLLGITWIFGLLVWQSDSTVFKYIFAIPNSLQGVAIFLFHCVLNKEVQDAIKFQYYKYKNSSSGLDNNKRCCFFRKATKVCDTTAAQQT